MSIFPYVPEELLTALADRFPDVVPADVPTPAETGVLVGQQRIIRFLKHQRTMQLEAQLEGSSS